MSLTFGRHFTALIVSSCLESMLGKERCDAQVGLHLEAMPEIDLQLRRHPIRCKAEPPATS